MVGEITTYKYFAANSKPLFDFIEEYGFENVNKDKRIKEYKISDSKNITIKDATIFLTDKEQSIIVGTLPKETAIGRPIMVYQGRVISEKRLKAFIEESK